MRARLPERSPVRVFLSNFIGCCWCDCFSFSETVLRGDLFQKILGGWSGEILDGEERGGVWCWKGCGGVLKGKGGEAVE